MSSMDKQRVTSIFGVFCYDLKKRKIIQKKMNEWIHPIFDIVFTIIK